MSQPEPIQQPSSKLEQWRQAPGPSEWLNSMLASDAGKLLLEVLKEKHPLTTQHNLPPGILTTNGAAISGLLLGYEQCLATLLALAENRNPMPQLVQSTFGVNSAQDATD